MWRMRESNFQAAAALTNSPREKSNVKKVTQQNTGKRVKRGRELEKGSASGLLVPEISENEIYLFRSNQPRDSSRRSSSTFSRPRPIFEFCCLRVYVLGDYICLLLFPTAKPIFSLFPIRFSRPSLLHRHSCFDTSTATHLASFYFLPRSLFLSLFLFVRSCVPIKNAILEEKTRGVMKPLRLFC